MQYHHALTRASQTRNLREDEDGEVLREHGRELDGALRPEREVDRIRAWH